MASRRMAASMHACQMQIRVPCRSPQLIVLYHRGPEIVPEDSKHQQVLEQKAWHDASVEFVCIAYGMVYTPCCNVCYCSETFNDCEHLAC